jgi:hypothetical protein
MKLKHVPLLLLVMSVFMSIAILEVERLALETGIQISDSFRGIPFGLLILSPVFFWFNVRMGVYDEEDD